MKTKYLFLAALSAIALTSCTSEDFLDTSQTIAEEGDLKPILFNSLGQGMTRADFKDAEAADKLGNKFVVTGFKGTTTASPGSIVFDNYLVVYEENTANTSESNTKNWEYVGKGVIKHATDHGITQQTIKYWDYTATQYDFLAWSTGEKNAIYTGDPSTGNVLVSTITPHTKNLPWITGDNPARPAYTFTGTADDLKECYISDLVTVNKSGTAGVGEVTGYNQPVTLKFRQLGTKVRIGIYETVPGYSVRDVKFYYGADVAFAKKDDTKPESTETFATDDAAATYNASAKIFTTVANGIYKEGKYTVYFPTVDAPTNADNNQAHIEFDPGSAAQKKIVEWGGLNYTIRESGESSADPIYLGRTSNTASFAGAAKDNYYVVYLPNQTGTNLNLRVNYTLESIDGSKETIEVKGATAQVPLIYTQWKPGYAYTYLFKISDKTNGYTGLYDPLNPDGNTYDANPAGLYPITFDAVVVNAEEDATQETITTISTPSITSYQQKSKVVNANEYSVNGKDIFVTVNDGTPGTATYNAVTNGTTLTGGNVYYTSDAGAGAFIAKGNEVADGTNYFFASVSSSTLSTGTLQTLTNKADLYTIPSGMTEAEVIDALSYYYTKAEYIPADPQPTSGNFSEKTYYIPEGTGYNTAASYAANTTYYTKVEPVFTIANPQPTKENFDENTYYTKNGNTYAKASSFAEQNTPDYYTKAITSFTTKGRSNKVLTGATYSLVDQVVFGADGNVISVGADQALRFTPEAGKTYAFVYTKTVGTVTGDNAVKFQPVTKAKGDDVEGLYRYKLKAADAGDVQEGVIYFNDENASTDMITPFLGQTVNNLYRDEHGNTIASGYAVTGTNYYFTNNNGQSYEKAHNVDYVDKNVLPTGLYELKNGDYVLTNDKTLGYEAIHKDVNDPLTGCYTYDATNHSYTPCTDATASEAGTYYKKVTGKAYYYKDVTVTPNVYRFCVFLPQQTSWTEDQETKHLYVFNGKDHVSNNMTDNALGNGAKAVNGMVYFDKYTYDDAVRYAKVIKVQ